MALEKKWVKQEQQDKLQEDSITFCRYTKKNALIHCISYKNNFKKHYCTSQKL